MWAPIIKYLEEAAASVDFKKNEMAKLMAMIRYTHTEGGIHVILEGNWSLIPDYISKFEEGKYSVELSDGDIKATKLLLNYLVDNFEHWDNMGYLTNNQRAFIKLSDKYYDEIFEEMRYGKDFLTPIPHMERFIEHYKVKKVNIFEMFRQKLFSFSLHNKSVNVEIPDAIKKIKKLIKECEETIEKLEALK